MKAGLTRQPYRVSFGDGLIPTVVVAARLGEVTRGEDEDFVPFVVTEVRPAITSPVEAADWALSRSR